MLIRFSVSNFKSYKETQVFSMIAGKYTKHKNHIVEKNGKKVLKASFFFGANAAGKSNLIEAINFAQNIIMQGLSKIMLINKHFRIDGEYINKPGVFQFDIFSNGHYYSYGFAVSYNNSKIEEEWLYMCDSTDIAIFERSIENGKTVINSDYHFSDDFLAQSFKIFSDNVPDEKTLLSEIAERKLIEKPDFFAFRDVMQWMKNIIIITPDVRVKDITRLYTDSNDEYSLENLLMEFDTGIEHIFLGEENMEEILDFLPEKIKMDIIENVDKAFSLEDKERGKPKEVNIEVSGRYYKLNKIDNQIYATQLMMNHGNDKDLFELDDESDGTKRLFDLLPVYNLGKTSHLILIDELDRSFHTKLVIKFIQGFFEKTLGSESQLVASVHDSNIMDLDLLRQDEIWFVERQLDHSTKIYSLNKFKERFDKKVSKDYLLGRYGAIPCFEQLNSIEKEEK